MCEFTEKEQAIQYVKERKTNHIVIKDVNVVYKNYLSDDKK